MSFVVTATKYKSFEIYKYVYGGCEGITNIKTSQSTFICGNEVEQGAEERKRERGRKKTGEENAPASS